MKKILNILHQSDNSYAKVCAFSIVSCNLEEASEVKKIYQLDYKDKAIHRHMSFAVNQLRKVARLIRENKSDSPEWQKHAREAEKAAEDIGTWLKAIKEE